MDKGYVRLYRKTLESPIFMDEKLLKVWIWCLLKATHQPYEAYLTGNTKIKLEKGQFVYGRKKAAEELELSESTFYRKMQVLKSLKMVNIKPNKHWTVATVENWGLYQCTDTEVEQNLTVQMDTYKNNNNIYNKNFSESASPTSPKPIRKQIPPTLAMVKEYCTSRQNNINPQNFIDYYTARDWFIGKNKMKDWQAAIRTWENNSKASVAAMPTIEVKKYDI